MVAEGNGEIIGYKGIADDGSPIAYSVTTNLDGKDEPYSGKGHCLQGWLGLRLTKNPSFCSAHRRPKPDLKLSTSRRLLAFLGPKSPAEAPLRGVSMCEAVSRNGQQRPIPNLGSNEGNQW